MNGLALSAEEERDERGENHRGEAGITAAAGASAGGLTVGTAGGQGHGQQHRSRQGKSKFLFHIEFLQFVLF